MKRRLTAKDIGEPDFTDEQRAEWLRCKGCSCGLIKDQEHADIEAGQKRVVEAGALIITPDEGKWPEWALHSVTWNAKGWYNLGDPQRILDALRDAMPDGDF